MGIYDRASSRIGVSAAEGFSVQKLARSAVCLAWVFMLIIGAVQSATAEDDVTTAESDPYSLVEHLTVDILSVVKQKNHLLETDPQAFYDEVNRLLEPVVAFDYIARGVMGRYGRQATEQQRQRFSEVFQSGLISTYAKGMALYGDAKITVVKPDASAAGKNKVSVMQKVKYENGEHTLSYTMGLSQLDQKWKLLNVVINGVNLGNTFRSQFAQAMEKSGNLDQVIDDWAQNS